jgi:hypothetical protein
MNDIMLDLETCGTGPRAAIIAIGAVLFDLKTGELGQTFLQSVDLESSMLMGGEVTAGTIEWWMKQSEEAKLVFTDSHKSSIHHALLSFSRFIDKYSARGLKVWGNGSDFDNVILRGAYDRCGMETPWEFRNSRCYRTVKNLFPDIKFEPSGVAHNALDDATAQATHLICMIGGKS